MFEAILSSSHPKSRHNPISTMTMREVKVLGGLALHYSSINEVGGCSLVFVDEGLRRLFWEYLVGNAVGGQYTLDVSVGCIFGSGVGTNVHFFVLGLRWGYRYLRGISGLGKRVCVSFVDFPHVKGEGGHVIRSSGV